MEETTITLEMAKEFLETIYKGHRIHSRQLCALSGGVIGIICGENLTIHGIGHGYANAVAGKPKHGIKQIDRTLANEKIELSKLFKGWVPFICASREELVVSLDWTEFAADDHSTLAISTVTNHGRGTPVIWKTARTSELKGNRNRIEDELLIELAEYLPDGIRVTILADRGFGDIALYNLLDDLGFDFVIRFRGNVKVFAGGTEGTAKSFLAENGTAERFDDAKLTMDRFRVNGFIAVREPGMKDAWYLATNKKSDAKSIVLLYGRRFTIEENFRDTKDLRFGMGLSSTHIGSTEKRDRLLFIMAAAVVFLTFLGRAGELRKLDEKLRANTVKHRRTHSLFRQGRSYLTRAFINFRDELRAGLRELLSGHEYETKLYAFI